MFLVADDRGGSQKEALIQDKPHHSLVGLAGFQSSRRLQRRWDWAYRPAFMPILVHGLLYLPFKPRLKKALLNKQVDLVSHPSSTSPPRPRELVSMIISVDNGVDEVNSCHASSCGDVDPVEHRTNTEGIPLMADIKPPHIALAERTRPCAGLHVHPDRFISNLDVNIPVVPARLEARHGDEMDTGHFIIGVADPSFIINETQGIPL